MAESDFVTKAFPDLTYPERKRAVGSALDSQEVDEDLLGGLGAEVEETFPNLYPKESAKGVGGGEVSGATGTSEGEREVSFSR